MLRIYGNMQCPDCVACREDLDNAGVAYEYLDISESLPNLKAFLSLRDSQACFQQVRQEGKIGIPCLVHPDGSVTLSWEEYVCQDKS